MMKAKLRIEEVVVLVLVVFLIIVLGCSKLPTIQQPVSYQSEAKEILMDLYSAQQAYRQEKGTYFMTALVAGAATPNVFVPELGIEVGTAARYSYWMGSETNATYIRCWAADTHHFDDDPAIDTWMIDNTGELVNVIDDTKY